MVYLAVGREQVHDQESNKEATGLFLSLPYTTSGGEELLDAHGLFGMQSEQLKKARLQQRNDLY